MAAALGNVDARDNWKVHFRDTMRGGKFLNVWRMAELHAKQAPERVRELEEWGAVFDRTKDGLISQRNFGGHRYPRLAHVGDRTGLELIRTLQDHGVHQGIDFHMECTALELLQGRRAHRRRARVLARDRPLRPVPRARPSSSRPAAAARRWRVTSNSWEYTGDGIAMAYDAGAELMDIEFTQFHPTGMVWPPSVRGILVTEGVRGDGGILLNNKGERFMFNYIPEKFAAETADTVEEADALARRRQERAPAARAADPRRGRARDHAPRSRPGAARRTAACSSTSPRARPADFIKRKLPSMYHQFKELAEVDITKEPMEVGPTLHYFMGGVRVDADTQMTKVPGCSRAASAARGCTARTGSAATRSPTCSCSASSPATARREYVRGARATPKADDDAGRARRSAARPTSLNRETGDEPVPAARRAAGRDGPATSASCARRTSSSTAIDELERAQGATPRT